MTKNKTEKIRGAGRPRGSGSRSPTLTYLMFHAIREAGVTGVWLYDVMKNINKAMPISYSVSTYYYSLSKLIGEGMVTTQHEQRLKEDGSGHFTKALKCFHVPGTAYRAPTVALSKYRGEQNVTWKPAGTWKAPETLSIPNSIFDFAAKFDN